MKFACSENDSAGVGWDVTNMIRHKKAAAGKARQQKASFVHQAGARQHQRSAATIRQQPEVVVLFSSSLLSTCTCCSHWCSSQMSHQMAPATSAQQNGESLEMRWL